MSLATQFGLAGGVVLVVAAIVVGAIVTRRIEDSVVRNSANATALYMESFLAPLSQQLAKSDHLSDTARRALEEVFTNTPLGERVVSYKIWKKGGRVVEASDPTLIDRVFEVSQPLKDAWQGQVSAEFEGLDGEESEKESALGVPLLEIYSPIREAWTGEVIAVAEFYEAAPQLREDLIAARRLAWATVAGVMLLIGGALYLIVLRGSRTIETQRADLDTQFRDLRALSARNLELRMRVQEAAARSAASTEAALRRIGADLHDGPAQYLAFAALRLDDLREKLDQEDASAELDGVNDALKQAMNEVRFISQGLSLPNIADIALCDVIGKAVDAHAGRTGQDVEVTCDCDGFHASAAIRICAYRFVQEGLNNATRHGGGRGLVIKAKGDAQRLEISVCDDGPGFGPDGVRMGLGLSGLRDRVESLSGTFQAANRTNGGSRITMILETGDQ